MRVRDINDQRSDLYGQLAAVLEKIARDAKNVQNYINERKKTEQTLISLKEEALRVAATLDEIDVGSAKRVRELERREARRFALQQSLQDNEVSYRARKSITKDAYESTKSDLEKQFELADEEVGLQISEITDSL